MAYLTIEDMKGSIGTIAFAEVYRTYMDLLKGIQILDLADEKASFCSKLLADLGARVIKLERPGGDPPRPPPRDRGPQGHGGRVRQGPPGMSRPPVGDHRAVAQASPAFSYRSAK
jgi:hypothetical protein